MVDLANERTEASFACRRNCLIYTIRQAAIGWSMRHLNGDSHRLWTRTRLRQYPGAQLAQSVSAVRKRALTDAPPVQIQQASVMVLARPIDPYKPSNLRHDLWSPSQIQATPRRGSNPVLALRARPPTGLASQPPRRGTGPPQVLEAQGAIGCSRRGGPVRSVSTPRTRLEAAERYRGRGFNPAAPTSTQAELPSRFATGCARLKSSQAPECGLKFEERSLHRRRQSGYAATAGGKMEAIAS